MTKYILAGGCDRKYPDYLRQLARIIQVKFAQPRILSCWFSNSDSEANEKFPDYKTHFLSFFNEGSTFIRADKDSFLEQVQDADVIYFHGGHTTLLFPAMEQYPSIKEAFKGKIVVGSSAGANYLSRIGFSPSSGRAIEGGAILDISSVVHYKSAGYGELTFESGYWDKAVQTVKEKSGQSEVLLLSEGTFAVFEA